MRLFYFYRLNRTGQSMVEALLVLLVFASLCFFGNELFQRARQAFTEHRQTAFEQMLTTQSP